MQLQGMSASGSVSEHDPERYSGGRSGDQTKDGNAGDRWRASNQQETGNSHTQSPENYADTHGVLQRQRAAPIAIACRCTQSGGNLSIR